MENQEIRRIVVFGNSGSGKSSLATKLGKKLDLPVFHLDKLYWLPNWVERPIEDMVFDVQNILNTNQSWVIDGNFKRTLLEERIKLADLIVFLDFNRIHCLYRALKRNLLHFGRSRPDMREGCNERINWEFIKFIWNFKNRTQVFLEKVLEKYPNKQLVIFRNQSEVDKWLETKEYEL